MMVPDNIRQHPDCASIWVSKCGRIFQRVNETHPERHQWVERKAHADRDGYLRVAVKGKNKLVHRLVYMIWGGELIPGLVVCHIDGDNTNNHIDNLAQTTQRENIQHKYSHGTILFGERHPRAKATLTQVQAVKRRLGECGRTDRGALARGEAARIAADVGTTIHIVRDIDRGRIWA